MITIRDLAPRDQPTCAAIFEAAWNDAFPNARRSMGLAEFAAETADEAVFVATVDGRVRGFASLYAPESFLHHLYVDPAAYRAGIGSALLREAHARANDQLSLKCQLSNAGALAFYAAHGFVEAEHGADAYGAWVRLVARGA